MEILVQDKFKITSDKELNYVVEVRTIRKSGKNKGSEAWGIFGYYPNLAHLAEDLLDAMPMDSDAKSIEELVKAVYSSRDAIVEAIKQIKK